MVGKRRGVPVLQECWVMLADGVPVGVYLEHQAAAIERLRLSKDEGEQELDKRIAFTLSDAVTLIPHAA